MAASDSARRNDSKREREKIEAEQFRLLVESVGDYAIFMLDPEGRIVSWNRGAERIKGYPADEVLGKHFSIFYTEEDRRRGHPEWELRVAAEQGRYAEEGLRVRKGGSLFPAHVTITALRDDAGHLVGFAKVTRDITERRHAEAIRESERRFREIAENIREVFWIFNPDFTRTLYVSPAYETVWGRSAESLYRNPKSFQEAAHPDDRARVLQVMKRLRREEVSIEYRIIRPDGDVRWVRVRGFPVLDERGEVYRVAGVSEDITLRKQEEEERARLLESEREARGEAERRAREEAALRRAAEAVNATFTEEEVIFQIAQSALDATNADGAFVERIDIERGELTVIAAAGQRAPAVGSRGPYPGSFAERVVERGESEIILDLATAERPMSEGVARDCARCSAMVVPLLNAGEPIGALVLVRKPEKHTFRPDEIQRARTFANLAALAFRKVHLLKDSERKREELERVMESRSRLMRGFSHDVKNPLGAADGYLQLLEMGVQGHLTEKQQESVEKVRRALHSALQLIEDLLELARAEAGEIEVERAPMSARDAAREMAEEYRAQAEAEGLTLDVTLPEEFPITKSDSARVRQILGNLISNAVKYTPEGGHIRVSAGVREGGKAPGPGRWVAVNIADTGPGLTEEQQKQLFEEFRRFETAGGERGTGIGLAISRRIARALGGDVTVESEVGVGSTFTLWLPLTAGR
jgi:PAS domain S-box-containing protein